jgi:3-phosphoshikimate 1-carboxyvinyltransferase
MFVMNHTAITIQPSAVGGQSQAPASKSAMQRACAAALLHNGTTQIYNPGRCNDDMAAMEVIQHLGAQLQHSDNMLTVISSGHINATAAIHVGESGLGVRMFTPLAALSSHPVHINGSGSLLTRPMHFFDAVLPQLQVTVASNSGKLPMTVTGPLIPQDITIDGSLSSQFLTGLLMAFGKAATKPVTITVTNLKSRPYIDLTLEIMAHFGYRVTNKGYEQFIIDPVTSTTPSTIDYTVEGDWSGAAFLLVAGAIAGSVTVTGLDIHSAQADRAIVQVLEQTGAGLLVDKDGVQVQSAPLKPFHFDATDCPDLFPPLVALAAYCDGTSIMEGTNRLTHKESNRAVTLQEEFAKLGVSIVLQGNQMRIKGGGPINGATVHSRHDHRIAMACAVAALRATGPVTIEEPLAVNKSYPAFWGDLEKLQGVS